ncbi:Ig-like domain-containing protein [Ideonella sp. DXS29W]|uniref:Ig-like domain-containing protein n=1 Tax=Ideonella lacteola TaxID=2984193 RepID=A0ABU9BQQ9_9BURK
MKSPSRLLLTAVMAWSAWHGAVAAPRSLSLEDRWACHTAVEQVYWRHRVVPGQVEPGQPFEQAVPSAVIRRKAEDALRKTAALAHWWHTEITAEQLQAELDRMAASSQSPQVLAELFAALGHDPVLAAECIARPVLVDRLVQSYFAADDRIHGEVRRQARRELATGQMATATRHEVQWVHDRAAALASPGARLLTPEAFEDRVRSLRRSEAGRHGTLTLGRFGPLREEARRLYAVAVDRLDADRVQVRTVSWPKPDFDRWWARQREGLNPQVAQPVAAYRLPALVPNANCRDDSWRPTLAGLDGRYEHTAVWTGQEMIVWGGMEAVGAYYGDGARYNPATDTWAPVSGTGAPGPRHAHSAVWTGDEMIVFGGDGSRTGGRYDPVTDTWRAMSTVGAPVGQQWAASVWTGKEFITWGGIYDVAVNTGARYNPKTDTWATLPAVALAGRSYMPGVWTGSEMVVWSGYDVQQGRLYRDGARYNPKTDRWTLMSTDGAPQATYFNSAVWTGRQVVTWGGVMGDEGNGRYDPATDTWAPVTTTGAPSWRYLHNAVWTGREMLVHGGYPSRGPGGRYDPATDTWALMATLNAPTTGQASTMVWTGQEALLWGGLDEDFAFHGDGGRYNPAADQWRPMTTMNVPAARAMHNAEWTGAEMIVWGGYGYSLPDAGARYDPATNAWSPITTVGQPAPRNNAASVWTGQEIIFWGAGPHDPFTPDSGGRYNPAIDSWKPVSRTNAPLVTYGHTAVWTGSEMITFGGISSNEGAKRYNPATNKWTNATMTNDPGHRDHHGAVWTGAEMVVWGGSIDSGELGPRGGRYNPSTNKWVQINRSVGQPEARMWPVAVWTGTEAVFWGGYDQLYTRYFNDGGRYNPATGQWTPTSLSGAPSPRVAQGVWTGADMVVWGGDNAPTGGRYRLSTDQWTPTSTLRAPAALWGGRWSTVWTGNQMIIWGGLGPTQKGGLYCLSGQANLAPLAVADTFATRAGKRMVVGVDRGVLLNDSDGNGDPLSARLISGPSHGTLQFNANGSFVYEPAAGYVGGDSFRYVARDDLADSPPATVKLKVK